MNTYATFGTRMACHIGDLMLIQFVVLPLYYILLLLKLSPDYELLNLSIWGIYSTVMNASCYKGTYAKVLMGVMIENDAGARLTYLQAGVRFIIGIILFGAVVGMLPIFFNRRKKGLHDILIGSVVKYRKEYPF